MFFKGEVSSFSKAVSGVGIAGKMLTRPRACRATLGRRRLTLELIQFARNVTDKAASTTFLIFFFYY